MKNWRDLDKEEIAENVYKNVVYLANKQGIALTELAELIGCNRFYFANMGYKNAIPNGVVLLRMSELLNVDMKSLLVDKIWAKGRIAELEAELAELRGSLIEEYI